MRITAQEEYGLRLMVLLASSEQTLTLAQIGEREGLSVPYVGKLLGSLKRANMVDAERGRHGGHRLLRDPNTIRLTEIFSALGEPLFDGSHCVRYGGGSEDEVCIHKGDCRVRDVWSSLQSVVQNILSEITLADLAAIGGDGPGPLLALVQSRSKTQGDRVSSKA